MTCPKCGQPAAPSEKFCGRCGAALSSAAAMPVMQYNAFCSSCHQRVEIGAPACPHCGIALDWPDALPGTPGSAPQAASAGKADAPVCPVCAKPRRPGEKFCGFCGAHFEPAPRKDAQAAPAQAAPAPLVCPGCAKPRRLSEKFCGYCGVQFETGAAGGAGKRRPVRTAAPGPGMRFCSECGKPGKPTEKFCGYCGARMAPPPQPEPLPGPQPAPQPESTEPMPEAQAAQPAADAAVAPAAACPMCKKPAEPGEKFCGYCGAALARAAEPPKQAQQQPEDVCPQCGRAVDPGELFCLKCGAHIHRGSAPPESTEPMDEHASFGPWVFEIGPRHILPPLFSGYAERLSGALMAFKIPRNIERRDARRYTHLYRTVVGVFGTHVLILNREGSGVSETRVEIGDIEAISNTISLLAGEMLMYTRSMVFRVNYSTVSDAVINKAVSLILAGRDARAAAGRPKPLPVVRGNIETLFYNLTRELKGKDPSIELAAYSPAGGAFRVSTAFYENGRELIVIDRTRSDIGKQKNEPVSFAYTYVFVPLEQIRDARQAPAAKAAGQLLFSVSTPHHTFRWKTSAAAAGTQALEAWLRAR